MFRRLYRWWFSGDIRLRILREQKKYTRQCRVEFIHRAYRQLKQNHDFVYIHHDLVLVRFFRQKGFTVTLCEHAPVQNKYKVSL